MADIQKPNDLTILERTALIGDAFQQLLRFKECCHGKEFDYIFSTEFKEIERQITESCTNYTIIRMYKNSLPRKISAAQKKEKNKEELEQYAHESTLITNCEKQMKQITSLKKELDQFKQSANDKILQIRIYVPEQYAGIATYDTNRFLLATHGMEPCVGVFFYCEKLRRGMVAHLDGEQEKLEDLQKYFIALANAMNSEGNGMVVGAVLSAFVPHSPSEELVYQALQNMKKQLGEQVKVVDPIHEKDTSACVLLSLKDGMVVTTYGDQELEGKQMLVALNAIGSDFMLYHLRNGAIYEQPIHDQRCTYKTRKDNIMIYQDEEFIIEDEQSSRTSSTVGKTASTTLPTAEDTAKSSTLTLKTTDRKQPSHLQNTFATLMFTEPPLVPLRSPQQTPTSSTTAATANPPAAIIFTSTNSPSLIDCTTPVKAETPPVLPTIPSTTSTTGLHNP